MYPRSITPTTNASSETPPRYAMMEPTNSVPSAIPSMIFTPFLSDRTITRRGEDVCESSYKNDLFREPCQGGSSLPVDGECHYAPCVETRTALPAPRRLKRRQPGVVAP